MKQPEGFVESGYDDYAWKLVHTIYRTMQGGHNWYETLSATFNKIGYITSQVDLCVQFKKENRNYTIIHTLTTYLVHQIQMKRVG